MAQVQPAAAVAHTSDLLTCLQAELLAAHENLCKFVWEQQQFAPPASVGGEDITAPPPAPAEYKGERRQLTREDVQQRAKAYAEQMRKSFDTLHALIDRLPDMEVAASDEEEQLRRIEALQVENQHADEELRHGFEAATTRLGHAQDSYAVLAQHSLNLRTTR